jgi:catechol 2,3-dioxygenase-like lactoylglutathione lyase family enzyme
MTAPHAPSPLTRLSRVDTVILRVRDAEASACWYVETLGFQVIYEDPAEGLVVLGGSEGSPLTLWQLKLGEVPAGGGVPTCYPVLASGDAASDHETLSALGVPAGRLEEGPGVTWFRFQDPDGNTLEACQTE